ncbi:MAG: dihydropteroate synthase [Candidatus Omnitrophica bacterium]|nr:dihydropteroate synthase [Candidatus Omnitrophota bacterium]
MKYLVCRKFKIALSKPLVMGVLNVTPDSFSDAGKYIKTHDAYKQALKMQAEGADIIDIGGESSRPGAEEISAGKEMDRVIPVLKKFIKKARIPVSVDTKKSEVAREALRCGASIINDITGLTFDAQMKNVIAAYKAAVILMHIKGSPRTMQNKPRYKNLIGEIRAALKNSINIAVSSGINKNSIVIDPGIGFGKTVQHNLEIIDNIAGFKKLGYPVLIGVSRKSFMGRLLKLGIKDRLIPTVACNAIAIANGANIIRVHDVKEAVWTKDIISSIINSGSF